MKQWQRQRRALERATGTSPRTVKVQGTGQVALKKFGAEPGEVYKVNRLENGTYILTPVEDEP